MRVAGTISSIGGSQGRLQVRIAWEVLNMPVPQPRAITSEFLGRPQCSSSPSDSHA